MNRLRRLIEGLNKQLYNPAGLNILWPKDVAFMFVSNLVFFIKEPIYNICNSLKSNTIEFDYVFSLWDL